MLPFRRSLSRGSTALSLTRFAGETRLFAIDKDTAEVSPIGSLRFNANGAVGFDFDDATGTLYLTSIDDNSGTGPNSAASSHVFSSSLIRKEIAPQTE